MASEENKRELEEKVEARVRARFGGDHRSAFARYYADGNGVISKDELKALLKDAGVGSGLTRRAWARGIMAISWEKFAAVFEGRPG